MADAFSPECSENGYFKPLQCGLWGCGCIMPDGLAIQGTLFQWGNPRKPNCAEIVEHITAGNGRYSRNM